MQPESQTVQSGPEPTRIEATGNTLSDVMTFPSTSQQLNQVGPRLIDRETNTSDIGGRSQGEEIRIEDSDNRNIPMPIFHSGLSSYDAELTGGSHMRTREIMPQLDGLMSVHSGKRIVRSAKAEQKTFQKTAITSRGEYPSDSSNGSHDDRRPYDDQMPPGRRRYHERSGRPPDRGNGHDQGFSGRGRPPDDGGPFDDGGPPDGDGRSPDGNGGPPDDGGPLMVEDLQEMEDDQDILEDHQAHQDLLDQCNLLLCNSPK